MFSIQDECYEEVKVCLQEIFEQVEKIGDSIQIDATKHGLDFIFVADWKMLAIVTGLKAANSNFSCIWCICHKDNFSKKRFNLCI